MRQNKRNHAMAKCEREREENEKGNRKRKDLKKENGGERRDKTRECEKR